MFSEAGLPNGVFNVIQGDKTIVDLIIQSPDISSVSFVGSTPVAKYIYVCLLLLSIYSHSTSDYVSSQYYMYGGAGGE